MSTPTVFITGAAAGIGRATALTFARHGYRVGAYDIDLAGLASLRDEITGHGGDVVIGRLDVTNAEEWSEQLEQFTGPSRRLDILVNNAGVLTTGAFQDVPLKTHEQMIDINQVEGRVRASSLKRIAELVDQHPEQAVNIMRQWMYQEA